MCKMVWYKLLLVLCFTFFPESCVPPPSSGTQQLPTAPLTIIATANPNKSEFVGEVIGIKDGDTVEVLHNNQSTVVRLEHIDCPEKKQPYATQAKQFVSDNCFGKNVKIWHNNKHDRYQRLLALIVFNDSVVLNKALVQAGLAWHYTKYSTDQTYQDLQNEAEAQKRGFWILPNPTPPWEKRDSAKTKHTG